MIQCKLKASPCLLAGSSPRVVGSCRLAEVVPAVGREVDVPGSDSHKAQEAVGWEHSRILLAECQAEDHIAREWQHLHTGSEPAQVDEPTCGRASHFLDALGFCLRHRTVSCRQLQLLVGFAIREDAGL